MRRIAAPLALAIVLGGCVTAPSSGPRTSYASYVGDRASVSLDEIVVSVAVQGSPHQYENLHVAFTALINPTELSISDLSDVRQIVGRLQPRIASRVVEIVTKRQKMSIHGLDALREELISEAQKVFDAAFSRWTHSRRYEVRLVITSFFLTNPSVGKAVGARRWGW